MNLFLPQELELDTQGTFEIVECSDETNRCGPLGSPKIFFFRAKIISHPNLLNPQGFVMDWQEVHGYFKTTFRTVGVFPSCEHIAWQACRELCEMLGERCLSMEVTVGIGKPAGMTARWHRCEVPA